MMIFLTILLVILQARPSLSFSCNPPTTVKNRMLQSKVILQGVLSRSDIVNYAAGHGGGKGQNNENPFLSKSFLLEVLDEALYRQTLVLEALGREIEKKYTAEGTLLEESIMDDLKSDERRANHNLDRIGARKEEIQNLTSKLHDLQDDLSQIKASQNELERIKVLITDLGFASIFRQPTETWKTKQARDREFGRPLGFDGQVFYSPLGVPILVGRSNAHKDEVMRNAAQGNDLWFQVEDYNGSRVLLRTSLVRGTKDSKQCRQMAADLAAKHSIWGEDHDSIPVMYTDSRKVAKRGSKVGQMKQSKSLGRILGIPRNVE
jgi:predicted ribosome quality control (RQC) complex YloA/Tae2 family protein